jgi:large subunit ribosomal protein L25
MTDSNVLGAELRDQVGKGAARATRRAGRVPAVVYGDKKDSLPVSLDPKELGKALHSGAFYSTLYDLSVDGKSEKVLARDVQLHPVTDRPLHVDFLRVSAKTQINVDVPVVFLNEEDSPGLKRGGVLNVVRHEIELYCRADAIPGHIDIDLTGLDIGDSVHISMVPLPEGVKPTIDRDFTIATIAAPSAIRSEEEAEAAEAAEEAEGEEAEGAEEGEESEAEASAED